MGGPFFGCHRCRPPLNPAAMGNKKNGKWVVAAVLGSVLLASAVAFAAQQVINANRGKPPLSQPYQPKPAEPKG